MNKELFVSSTPHETKVGLVEDDLLAEVYLERENEYTLAGSIYKGRVTRVLPGMQSAFVDLGLERDAFLYVSDFMELEEHDEDVTDVVPAGRGVPDLRPHPVPNYEPAETLETAEHDEISSEFSQTEEESSQGHLQEEETQQSVGAPEVNSGAESQNRGGGYRNSRRRRRGGRRDGRSEGRSDGRNDTRERTFARPVEAVAPPRAPEPVRTQQFGPPAGYEPILLPGESISKYQRFSRPAVSEPEQQTIETADVAPLHENEPVSAPVASAIVEDEPILAQTPVQQPNEPENESASATSEASSEATSEDHDRDFSRHEEVETTASTTINWSREFRQPEDSFAAASAPARTPEIEHETESFEPPQPAVAETKEPEYQQSVAPVDADLPRFAAPGTLEEETIDEEEAETLAYGEPSDEGYDEFEEETRAAGQASPDSAGLLNSVARDAVSEIHMAALAETPAGDASQAEAEDDSEELELEEAQAEAEALLEAEARGNGTVDARVEVRAPSTTAGYTQRAPRPAPGFDRRNPRGRRGGRRFRPQAQDIPKISELLKEGQEILVQIAKEPIGKKGARITSHIALPGRFLVYMPTVNHTGVSRKIASDEERQRLKRIVMSERDNGHGGFIVRTAAQSATEEELRADIRFLKGLWNDIKTRSESSKSPALIYHDLNVVERVLRDQVTSDFSVIWVDTEPEYERILRFFNRFQPGLIKRVKLYTKETPLFEQFGLAEEMNKALKSKVWLKSGGYIVINQTEALVAIDINTGKYVGKTARLEDTIVKTNVDAIKEIVRQIRLRDLGRHHHHRLHRYG
jgi:Rne/Rng family ribonuclease